MSLEPWIYGPFELIKHAEEHQQVNGDFDKRMALVSYDNAIEVSINTYLRLHPTQRDGAIYKKEDVAKWLTNYYTMLDFFFDKFVEVLGEAPSVSKQSFIHYHSLRNNLYHEGRNFQPTERDIQGIREAALYVFSTLFNVNGEQLLKNSSTIHGSITKKIIFRGEGSDINKVHLKVGAVIFRTKYRGGSYLRISLYNEDETLLAKLRSSLILPSQTAIHTETYTDVTNIKVEGVYLLKVNVSSGTWEIEIKQ